MNKIFCAALLLVLTTVSAQELDHYQEGQRLFEKQDFAGALDQFQKAEAIVPDDATINSWIGACLNALGRHAEAKQRLQTAFKLLAEQEKILTSQGQTSPPIPLPYYVLLAQIQINLREFPDAVRTVQSYEIPKDPSEDAVQLKQQYEDAKKGVYSRLVAMGVQCLGADDVDCARAAFTQADVLDPAPPVVMEWVARDALVRAVRAPATTDEEKTKKAALYESAIDAARLWATSDPNSVEAQRALARTLTNAKTPESMAEASTILTGLWARSADGPQKDASIQLDLATVYTALEKWDQVIAAATLAIETGPPDPEGDGYCKRSYALYRLSKCQEAIEDGARCKNADGTTKTLKHVDTCKQRLADHEARVAADRDASTKRDCGYLVERVKWVLEAGDISLQDLLQVIREYRAAEGKCSATFSASLPGDPDSALCKAGVSPAASPLNLSSRSKEELEQLRTQIQDFSNVCKSALDGGQTASVKGGLQKVDQALSMYR